MHSSDPIKKRLVIKYNLIELLSAFRVRWHQPPPLRRPAILTFDDGPLPNTGKILEALDRHDLKATFFMVASRMRERPDIVAEVLARGHTIGSHGSHHIYMKFLPLQEFRRQVLASLEVIEDLTGFRPQIFRPPHGSINKLQIAWLLSRGLRLVYWSHQLDAKRNLIVESWPSVIGAGPIILLHDYDPPKAVEAAARLLKGMRAG
jgi:peptidoglycan/xylan/chitin deacetylase (PgdA/CDA1 family)